MEWAVGSQVSSPGAFTILTRLGRRRHLRRVSPGVLRWGFPLSHRKRGKGKGAPP